MEKEKQVTAPDVLFWKGVRVNDMTETDLRKTVGEMGQHILSMELRLRTETGRTAKWMKLNDPR